MTITKAQTVPGTPPSAGLKGAVLAEAKSGAPSARRADGFKNQPPGLPQPPIVQPRANVPTVSVGSGLSMAKRVAEALPPKPLERSFANPTVFDATFYLEHNPDLRKAGLTTPAQLEEHWLTFGVREGRVGSATFDTNWCHAHYGAEFPNMVRTPEDTIRTWNGLSVEQQSKLKTSALTADLPYGSRGLHFDLYTPPVKPTDGKKVPVVISFVGGGYLSANNKHPVQVETGVIFASKGIAVLSPQYSVAPVPYPTPQRDAQELLKYVKDHAAENNWDLDDLTLMGGSAGGHLVLDTATNPAFQDASLPKVKNVISMAAPGRAVVIPGFIGPDQLEQASPINHIAKNPALEDTRFFITYADDDNVVPANLVTPLIDALQAEKLKVTVREHKTGGHGNWLHPEDGNPSFDRSFQYLMADWVLG